jgi:MFS superfamily sulfate permease-like transporter
MPKPCWAWSPPRARPGNAAVVLSLEESDDLDSTAAEAIGELHAPLLAHGGRLILARTHDRARAVLAASGLDELARCHVQRCRCRRAGADWRTAGMSHGV